MMSDEAVSASSSLILRQLVPRSKAALLLLALLPDLRFAPNSRKASKEDGLFFIKAVRPGNLRRRRPRKGVERLRDGRMKSPPRSTRRYSSQSQPAVALLASSLPFSFIVVSRLDRIFSSCSTVSRRWTWFFVSRTGYTMVRLEVFGPPASNIGPQ